MVNRLSELAGFLEDESVPAWVKKAFYQQRDEIVKTLAEGRSYTLSGPDGASITIAAAGISKAA